MTTTYPVGYGTARLNMVELQRRFGPNMHPEYARRLWAWIASENGKIGIGSGERSTATATRLWLSNPLRFANPLNSFHCQQKWPSGKYYAAVDLVVGRAGATHRSPTWLEGDSAKQYGLHAFIRRDGRNPEPWHLQPIIASYGFAGWGEGNQTRSASAWRKAGSPDLERWPLPTEQPPNPTPPPPSGSTNIVNVTVTTVRLGDQGGWVRKMQAILTTFGQEIPVDGDFGPTTERAVKAVQAFMGATAVDGICGPATWGILLNLAPDA